MFTSPLTFKDQNIVLKVNEQAFYKMPHKN